MDEMKNTLEETEDHGDLLTADGRRYYRPAGESIWWDQDWKYTPNGTAQVTDPQLRRRLNRLARTLERQPYEASYPDWDVAQLQKSLARDFESAWVDYEVEGLTAQALDPIDDFELAAGLGISEYDEAGQAAVTAALDAPWEDGPSLRERYQGFAEPC